MNFFLKKDLAVSQAGLDLVTFLPLSLPHLQLMNFWGTEVRYLLQTDSRPHNIFKI